MFNSKLKINFIGAGNLGKTIAKLMVLHNIGKIQGICNSSLNSGINAVNFIGHGKAYVKIKDLPPAEITFITTPDAKIQHCCEELCKSANFNSNSTIVHCSGALSSDILQKSKSLGCNIVSVHPIHPFANPEISVDQYKGTYCAIEGDQEAIETLTKIFKEIGSIIFEIDKSKKNLYHAAGVFASNYLVTLHEIATLCLKQTGIEAAIAKKIVLSLMTNTLNNLQQVTTTTEALTGALKRGDAITISKHLQMLADLNLTTIYRTLGLATLNLTELPQDKKDEIEAIFNPKIEVR